MGGSPHIEALGLPVFFLLFMRNALYVYVFDSEDICSRVAEETKWER